MELRITRSGSTAISGVTEYAVGPRVKADPSPSFAKRDRVRDDDTLAWFLVALLVIEGRPPARR